MTDPEDRTTRDLFTGTEQGAINRPLWLRPRTRNIDGTSRLTDPDDQAQADRLSQHRPRTPLAS